MILMSFNSLKATVLEEGSDQGHLCLLSLEVSQDHYI